VNDAIGNPSAAEEVASQGVRLIRVAGIPYAAIRVGLDQRVAFRIHPVQKPKKRALNSPAFAAIMSDDLRHAVLAIVKDAQPSDGFVP
jgi:hypothetical protein